jgi:hypothetical protein
MWQPHNAHFANFDVTSLRAMSHPYDATGRRLDMRDEATREAMMAREEFPKTQKANTAERLLSYATRCHLTVR